MTGRPRAGRRSRRDSGVPLAALAVAAAFCLAAPPPARAQARLRDYVWTAAPLAGAPSSPRIEGDAVVRRVERRDASGRLVSLSLPAPAPAPADRRGGESAAQPGAESTPEPGTKTAPKSGSESAPKKEAAADPGTAASAPVLRRYSYDSAGYLAAIEDSGGDGAAVRISRDASGRPMEARSSSPGVLAWVAAYSYSGSGAEALIVYRDAEGAPLAADEIGFGGGASGGGAIAARRLAPGGTLLGEAYAATDARGLLTEYLCLAGDAADESAEAAAGEGAGIGAGEGGPSLPPPGFLLFPDWPGEARQRGEAPDLAEPPFAMPSPESPGRAEFLRDAAGRLLAARLQDSTGVLVQERRYAYDARGLLSREIRTGAPAAAGTGAAAGAAAEGPASELLVYRYPEGSSSGWTRRDVLRAAGYREGATGDWELVPLERQVRSAP